MANEDIEIIHDNTKIHISTNDSMIDAKDEWIDKIPNLKRANWNEHIFSQFSQNHKTNNPYVWSPAEEKLHHMKRGIATSILKQFGKLTNIGRHNVPSGYIGISENNGKLVLLGPGNHWLISPNHKYLGNQPIGQPDHSPYINIRDQVMVVFVKRGNIAVVNIRGEYIRLLEGIHVIEAINPKFLHTFSLNEAVLRLGNVELITVPAGYIGFALNSHGELLKLESGKHILQNPTQVFVPYSSVNDDDDDYNSAADRKKMKKEETKSSFVSLNERVITMKPYLRFRVEGNEVCVISNEKGEFELLSSGIHEYFDPNVTLKDYLPLSQRNLSIKPLDPFKTSDNADVLSSFDVYFEIADPDHTIKSLCDPEKCTKKGDLLNRISEWVKEKAIDAMAAVVIHYQATDIAVIPDVKSRNRKRNRNRDQNEDDVIDQQNLNPNGDCSDRMHSIRQEFIDKLTLSLESVGIRLDSINLNSGLQIISHEAKTRVEGLIGAGAKEQLMMADQRALLVKADTEKQTAEIQAQVKQLNAIIQAETEQKIVISNAEANQKATAINAEAESIRLKARYNALIDCFGTEKAFLFLQNEQNVEATRSFANTRTIITGNSAVPSLVPQSNLLLNSLQPLLSYDDHNHATQHHDRNGINNDE